MINDYYESEEGYELEYAKGWSCCLMNGKESDNPYNGERHERYTTYDEERHYQWYRGFWDCYEYKSSR